MENMKIFVTDDYEKLSEKAAEIIAAQINGKPKSVIGLPTGGTPVGTYKELAKLYKAGKVDFSQVTTFNLDEYYPIKKANDQSYDYFMKDNLFNHINADFAKINIPNGEAPDAEAECLAYEEKIKNAGGIDFQVLGIGPNGHIGFNEPSDFFTSITNHVTLQESTIAANARFFASADDVPRHAISMGIGTIMKAKKILLIVTGENKADIIKQALFGKITPMVPASALQLHQDVTVILDKAAAKLL